MDQQVSLKQWSTHPGLDKELGDGLAMVLRSFICPLAWGLPSARDAWSPPELAATFIHFTFKPEEWKPLQAGVGTHLYLSCRQGAEWALVLPQPPPGDMCCLYLLLVSQPSVQGRGSEVPRCAVTGHLFCTLRAACGSQPTRDMACFTGVFSADWKAD